MQKRQEESCIDGRENLDIVVPSSFVLLRVSKERIVVIRLNGDKHNLITIHISLINEIFISKRKV